MTPEDIREIRTYLGLSQNALAEVLRLGPNGGRTIRRWESGEVPISGPASVALNLLALKKGTEREEVPHLGSDEDD